MVVHCQGHVLLKVLKAFRDEVLDPEWKLELVNLFLVSEMGKNCGSTPVLERLKVSLQHSERHFCLGCRATHNGIERLLDIIETRESHTQTLTILVECQCARHSIKVETDCGGNVFSEWFDILFVPARVPHQPLVTQSPAVLVLSQHVDKCINMQSGSLGPDTKHHACPEYSLRHVDLPIVAATIEHPGASHSGCAIRPVGMEVSYPLLGTIEPHLMALVILVP